MQARVCVEGLADEDGAIGCREWDCTLQHMQDGVPLKIYKARPHAGDASGKPQHSDAMDM